jgi:hypothetical protein
MQLDYSIWLIHEHKVNVFWLDLEAVHLEITLLDNFMIPLIIFGSRHGSHMPRHNYNLLDAQWVLRAQKLLHAHLLVQCII